MRLVYRHISWVSRQLKKRIQFCSRHLVVKRNEVLASPFTPESHNHEMYHNHQLVVSYPHQPRVLT
jgi:hypothetical protein